MHVLLIHQSFVDHEHPGGTRHFELASYLVNHGHQVTIVAGNLGYLTGKQFVETKKWIAEERLGGIKVLRAYVYPSLHRSFVWRVVSFLSFMITSTWAGFRAGPVDVVWGTSPPIFQLSSTWLIAAFRRRPLLLEIRDLWPEFAIGMGVLKNRWLIAIARWFEGFFYARARHIIVNSPAYRDYLLSKGVEDNKVSVVPNGVDPSMFEPDCEGRQIREEFEIEKQFVVTYAGALGQANDIPTILNAAKRLEERDDIHFLLAGDGKERANLEADTRRRDINNVLFVGTFSKSRMKHVLAASDVCVATLQDIPMFRTTYPNKVFDYMAAGRPTILAIDGVIRDVIEASHGGVFVQPGNDEALANAIVELKNDPSKTREMGRNARTYVAEHFDRQQHAEQLVQLLDQMVAQN